MRQEITLHNVALDALDAAGQLGESRDGLFDALEFVIVEAERRHDKGGGGAWCNSMDGTE